MQTPSDKPMQGDNKVVHWLEEIAAAERREADFRKRGRDIQAIYYGNEQDKVPFNILYSNIETILPSVYSQTPRPIVQRRFKDSDELGMKAAIAAQRMLEFLCDTNVDGYESFDSAMISTVIDANVVGRGISRVKYDAEISRAAVPVDDNAPLTGETGQDAIQPEETVKWEQVCSDSCIWDRVYFGYAKKWSNVPWVAFEEYVDKEEAKRLFGDEIADRLTYSEMREDDDKEGGDAERNAGGIKTCRIYQIWDKAGGKKVLYVSPSYMDGVLNEIEDPLGLTGFFNIPRPLQFLVKTDDLRPTAPYLMYENQAKELNRLTRRLKNIVEAIKVRGAYDGSLGSDIENILKGEDNELTPTDKGASLAAEGGLEKAIWMLPIDKLITVASSLVQAREQCKRVIYEINGIGDIIRGHSVASETLGAQKIKENWGTMRLKRMQRDVQRYARDLLRMKLEVAAKKMNQETWARATGLPFTNKYEQARAKMQMDMILAQGEQPPPNLVEMVNTPAWEDILSVLSDDIQRAYRVDIETNSTLDVDATEDQANIGQFMNAMGQFMNGITPMVEKGAMPFEAAKQMMLAIVRRYRFGVDVEDELKKMSQPQLPKQDAESAQAEAQAGQIKLRIEQARMHGEMERVAAERERMRMEYEAAKAEHEMKMREISAKTEMNAIISASKMRVALATAKAKEAAAIGISNAAVV